MAVSDEHTDEGQSVYFIAEAGVNHNGDVEMGLELVNVAARAGADAVKFQTLTADRLATESAPMASYQEATGDESQYEMLTQFELDRDDHERLIDRCEQNDITFLSTPFDPQSANLLRDLGVSMIKIGSGELDNHPLLSHVAEFGKPMIVSTGMGTMEEVKRAYDVIRSANPNVDLSLLHCTSEYPTAIEETNLRAMQTMRDEFSVPVGYSDHTTEVETPGFAVAAGATIVEKHVTLDKSLPGPDHAFALEPDELDRSVSLARRAGIALGSPEKRPTEGEEAMRSVIRKSLHAATAIEAGSRLTEESVAIKRPADGISPAKVSSVLGKKTVTSLDVDDPITWEAVEGAAQ